LGTGKNVSHIYSQEDTFYVNLTLNFNFSNLTCSYDASQTIEHGLFADFMADTNRCRYDSIAFTNTTPDTNGLHFTWRFGGSADTIRGYEAGWQYPDTGDFAVELVARNADSSCKSTELKPQYISIQEPDAAFSGGPLLSNCPPLNSAFTASNPAGVQSFIWDFGNGPPSTLGSPTAFVNYNLPDTHDVQLIAVDTLGCRDTVTKTDYVKVDGPLGNFNFTGIDNCLPDTVQIHVGFQQGIDEVIIDMGDGGLINKTLTGNTDTLDTTYVYTSAGTYSPQLILQDGNCSVEFDYPLSAPQPSWSPLPNVAYAVDTPVCLGSQAEFNNQTTSPVGGLSYSWSFGDGNTASTSDPLHRYPSTGTYDVRLIATDSKGCKDTLEEQQRVSVVDTPAIQALVDNSPAAATFCREDTFQLGQTWQQQTSAPYNWNWRCLNSPCNIDDASAPATFAIAENSSDYILSVSDAHQCSDSDTVSVTVNPLPAVTTGPDKLICAGEAVQLSASGAQSYNWTPGTLLDDATLAQPSARLDTPVTFVVRGTDANGCQDTAQQTVSVTRIDTIAADTAFCAGGRVQLNVGPEGNAVEWQPAAGLSDPQSYTPLAQPEDSTTYAAIVTYSANCVDTDSVAVGVFPALNTQAGPDTTLCQGSDSLQLTASGGDVFQWTPPTGLSADTGTSVMARPASNTAYQVVARDTSTGCRDTAGAAYRYHPTAPEAAFSLPSFAFVQTPVTLENTTSNASSYSWRFTGATPAQATGEAPPQLTYTEPGDYPIELAVADKNECRDTARKTLQIRKAPSLRVPSVFSPNGDGINEEVHVISSVPLEEYTFRVFTRHGRKVFTTDDFSDGWDGTLPNGSPAPEGVYTYYMKGTNFRGNTIERSGHITLVR
jgi:gliding motility-associated-like protein